jgi:hypothetical protein
VPDGRRAGNSFCRRRHWAGAPATVMRLRQKFRHWLHFIKNMGAYSDIVGQGNASSETAITPMMNKMIIFFGKKFYPNEDPWDQRRKAESILTGVLALVAAAGAIFFYICFVARIFIKISTR